MKHLPLTALTLLATALTCGARTWSYSDCVDYARTHNITLQKALLSEQTANINLDEAEGQWEPTLDFATTHAFTNYPWGEGTKNGYNSSYGLNAGWTVWNGGQRENTIRRNKILTEVQKLNTGHIMRTLETDLLQVYINILYAKESIGIYEEAARLSAAQAERAKALMEAGRASRVDYAQLRSQAEQDAYALVNAKGLYDTRRMELKKLLELGIDSSLELLPVEWTPQQVLAQLPPIDESYNLALSTDLRLRQLELQKESADADIAIARAGRMPRISLSAGVGTGYSAPGRAFGTSLKQSWNESIGLTFALPILDAKKTRSDVARARVQKLDADLDIDLRHTELAQLVENWYIDTRSAQSQYEAAREQLNAAILTADLTEEQFKLGLVNPVELMTAHNTLTQARCTALQTKYMAMLGQKMIEFYRNATVVLP